MLWNQIYPEISPKPSLVPYLNRKKSHDAIYRIVGIKQEKEGGKR
jgi:hypothetical protein